VAINADAAERTVNGSVDVQPLSIAEAVEQLDELADTPTADADDDNRR